MHIFKVLANTLDTSKLLLFLGRNESSLLRISFVAVAIIVFQVFLAQTIIWLKKSNSKKLRKVVVFVAQNEETNKM